MPRSLEALALDQIFREAHTNNAWTDQPVPESLLRELYGLASLGPTSMNTCPARFVWVRSEPGKRALAALAMETNKARILAAPVTVVIGYDLAFAERMPQLLPGRGEMVKPMFTNTPATEPTAFRNSSLQGAYLIIAARALGLDTGPMSGFDNAGVDAAFLAGTEIKSNFLCCLGYGDPAGVRPRNPRLSFEEAGRFA